MFPTIGTGIAMDYYFTELAHIETPMGTLSLRHRKDPVLGQMVHEIKLNDEFLMSSLFTVAEEELGRRGLSPLEGADWDVVVGGLGLGYTARAALEQERVRTLFVIEALAPVLQWHREGLLPIGRTLTRDPRCRLVHGDFFAMAKGDGFDPDTPGRSFHAILLDVDHSPRHTLHPSHAWLYERDGLKHLRNFLQPGGVFTLWSNDPPDDAFLDTLSSAFPDAHAQVVSFHNLFQDKDSTNTLYHARHRGA